ILQYRRLLLRDTERRSVGATDKYSTCFPPYPFHCTHRRVSVLGLPSMTSQNPGVDCVLGSPLCPNGMLQTPYVDRSAKPASGSKQKGSSTTSMCASSSSRPSAVCRRLTTRQLGSADCKRAGPRASPSLRTRAAYTR